MKYREQMYKMCDLIKVIEGTTYRIFNTWVRSEIAIPGKTLVKLKDVDSGVVRDGWTVLDASKEERPESYLVSRLHKHSDLSTKCDM
jgi:hypothetical protein